MKNKGFTLIEFMIIITICGILAAVALPALTKKKSPIAPAQTVSNEFIISETKKCEVEGLDAQVDWRNDFNLHPYPVGVFCVPRKHSEKDLTNP